MNSSTITGAASPLTPQFEASRPLELPSVPEIDPAEELETPASDDREETEAGLIRLAEFLKRRKFDRSKKNHRAIQAYETVQHLMDPSHVGAMLDRHQ